MKDIWFGDNRDLVKWSTLIYLANKYGIKSILQIAYYSDSEFNQITVDNETIKIPDEVKKYFRDINKIVNLDQRIKVFSESIDHKNRNIYLGKMKEFINKHEKPCIVFLDPDTGFQPQKCSSNHASKNDIEETWQILIDGDILALYQHKRRYDKCIDSVLAGLVELINIDKDQLKVASAKEIANDVYLFYIKKETL